MIPLEQNEAPSSLTPIVHFNLHGIIHRVVVDSTYSGLWIAKTGCHGCPNGANAQPVDPNPSQLLGSETTQQIENFEGRQGSVTCEMYRDTMAMGDLSPELTDVCLASLFEGLDDTETFDGVFGLGTDWKMNKYLKGTFAKLDQKIVAIYWDHPKKYGQHTIGQLGLGALRHDKLASVKWVSNLIPASEWTIRAINFNFEKDFVYTSNKVVVDTRTRESAFEKRVFDWLVQKLNAVYDPTTKRYKVSYAYVAQMPPIDMRIVKIKLYFDPLTLLDLDMSKTLGDDQEISDFAYLAIHVAALGVNVLGTNLLSDFHMIFDYDNMKLGFGDPILTRKRKSDDESNEGRKKTSWP